MTILVCVKQVPNTTAIKIDPETNTLIRKALKVFLTPMMVMRWKPPRG